MSPVIDRGMAKMALMEGLRQKGIRFVEDNRKAVKLSSDPKAPLIMQVTRMLDPPYSGPQLAQVDVIFEAGEIMIGQKKISTNNSPPAQERTANRYSELQEGEGEDEEGEGPREPTNKQQQEGDMDVVMEATNNKEARFLTAIAWPAARLVIRMQVDPCPSGRIALVYRNLQCTMKTTGIATQEVLASFLGAPTHQRMAILRAATISALKGKLPKTILEDMNVEYKLHRAPMTYVRATQVEMLRGQLKDGTKHAWAVPGFEGLQVTFTVEHDYLSAAKEEKMKQDARMQTRQEHDRSVEGRKVKLYGTSLSATSSSESADKQALHARMRQITQQLGGTAMEEIWTDRAIVSFEAGKDGRKSGASNGSGGSAYYIVCTSKGEAEWLVAATKMSLGNRLTMHGQPVQAHICRLRKPPPHSSLDDSGGAGRPPQRGSTTPPMPRAAAAPPPDSSLSLAQPPSALPPACPPWGGRTSLVPAPQPSAKEPAGSLAQAPQPTPQQAASPSDDLVAQLIRVSEQNEAENKRLKGQIKQQDTNTQRQLEKWKQTLQAETQKQLDQVREETAAQLQIMKAAFQKQLKAQQDIGLQETQKMMFELKALMDTQQEALLGNMKEMLREALSEFGARSKPGFTFDIGTNNDSTSKKRRHAEGQAAAVAEDTTNGMLEEDRHSNTTAHDDHTTSTDHISSSLPMAPAGGGGGGY
jgi:hypothetical protein